VKPRKQFTIILEGDPMTSTPAQNEAAVPEPRKRTITRPTTPQMEAAFFKLFPKLSKRESAMLLWGMGRLSFEELVAEFSEAP
jgi:hypothetical protein